MPVSRARRQQPPITYRDRQDRVWFVSEVAVLKAVSPAIDGPNVALVIRFEHEGQERFARWLGDTDWRERSTLEGLFETTDPAEVARSEYRIRMHLDQLQQLVGSGDRVDRFAVATAGGASTDSVLRRIKFGFRAYPSREIAVETSKTFLVASRFRRAIGIITIVASATFLLSIMLLKGDERRRDVAAMRLMGISRSTVIRTVLLESSFVALLRSLFGVGLAFVTSAFVNAHYQSVYRTPLRFAIITPSTVMYSVLLSLVLGIGAGALAARRLARTPPLTLFGR